MMRRLRDEIDSTDPTLARAAALLASRPPLDTDRMWGRALPPIEPARRRRPVLRVALVLAITFGSVVAGAATALPQGTWWAEPWTVVHALIGTGTQAPRPVPSHAAVDTHAAGAPGPVVAAEPAAPPAPPEVAPPAAPLATPTAPVNTGRAMAANRAAQARAANDAARAADGESALMLDAVRALRRDRDPARALSLAETALDRYPHGAQVEEAMALGMEAASAAGDGATARKLAERYLASFRAGRFTDRAQQIVSASSH